MSSDNERCGETITVTLGAQTSAEDDRTMPHVIELRKLLAMHCQGSYSSEVSEFALVLRIGGAMQEFDFEGCERIRRRKKEKYITVDLGFPSYRWKRTTDKQIRTYLVELVETGLLCCIQRLERDSIPCESSRLLQDFAAAKQAFLTL